MNNDYPSCYCVKTNMIKYTIVLNEADIYIFLKFIFTFNYFRLVNKATGTSTFKFQLSESIQILHTVYGISFSNLILK